MHPHRAGRNQMIIPGDSLSRIQLLVFDLDGTLVDSETDLTLSNPNRKVAGQAFGQ